MPRQPRQIWACRDCDFTLKGRRRGTWSVSVSGNWRVTFRFDGKDAVGVDYEDYH